MADLGVSQLSVLVFCSILVSSPAHAYIYAHFANKTSMLFEDLPAYFGSPLPKEGLMGILVVSHPLTACTAIDPPPPLPHDANITKVFVLIRRYECNFDIKVLHAQQAGYSAAIIHNMYSDTLLNMNYSNETIADEIEIPSVFTSYFAGQILQNFSKQGSYLILKPEFAFPLSYYLIPFTGVVGMVIIVMCVILLIRCVQYRKRLRKNRLSKEQLKRIPIHKFTKGDDYDVCAICLDEYEEGDKLRVLPCLHAYHCNCVDPWLTQTKKTCPVCKQRVTRNNLEHSESESEEENGGHGEDEGAERESERTPLLRPSNPASPSGNPGSYSATTNITAAQCLTSTPHCNSPILVEEYYYSPEEETDTESDDAGEDRHHTDDDTAQLITRVNI